MRALEWIQFFLSLFFLISGMVIFFIEVFGVYRFRFVLNRMQVAATGDTLGLCLCMVGLMIANGADWATAKLLLVLLFFWMASPVCSHMLSRLEYFTDENLSDNLRVVTLDEVEREIREEEQKKQESGKWEDEDGHI